MQAKPRILRRSNNTQIQPPKVKYETIPLPLPLLTSKQLPVKTKPPYSYMAMIEMAINSSRNNRMTLRDIYDWIESNFDYFQTAKPGWKNSIRHNLSLHDIFVRESDEKNSTWSLKIDENKINRKPLTFETVLAREGRGRNSKRPLQDISKMVQNCNNTPVKQPKTAKFPRPLMPNSNKLNYSVGPLSQKFKPLLPSPSINSPIPSPHPSETRNCKYRETPPTILSPNTSQTKFVFYPVQLSHSSTPKSSQSIDAEKKLSNLSQDSGISRSPLVMVCRDNNTSNSFSKNSRKSRVELLNDTSVENGLLDTSGSDTTSSNNSSPLKDGKQEPKHNVVQVDSSWATSRVKLELDPETFNPLVSSRIEHERDPFRTTSGNDLNSTDVYFDTENELEISRMLETYDLSLLQLEDLDKI